MLDSRKETTLSVKIPDILYEGVLVTKVVQFISIVYEGDIAI